MFDNDGVLVSRTAYDVLREAAWSAFDAAGVLDPDPDHVESMIVGVSPERVASVCDAYDLDGEEFWRLRERTATEVQRSEALAGRKTPYEDVHALDRVDVSLGVVSSNQQATVDFLLDHFGLDQYFSIAYGREPTVESLRLKKPHPHYVERAMEALEADSALFVGDNDSDVEAAEEAGADSAFIRRPHRRNHRPEPTPTYVVDDLHDVVGICRATR